MKVLNCCHQDWANFSHENANALRAAGIYCVDVKEQRHAFNYANQSRILSRAEILKQMHLSDVIQIMHSDLIMLDLAKLTTGKRIIVYHTGTQYRQNSEEYDLLFNPVVDFCITDQCEFMFKKAKGLKYIATAIDVKKIKPIHQPISWPYKIAHFPSNAGTKGSKIILEQIRKLHNRYPSKFGFRYSEEKMPHVQQLFRMQNCDMYIELFALEQNGVQYGCYGVTAFEAAAMGKIVFTQNVFPNVYSKTYGCEHKFVINYSEQQFYQQVEEFINKSPKEINNFQAETRQWLVEKHSYIATGKILKSFLHE